MPSSGIDLHGPHHLDLAIELGVPPSRINTISSFAKATSIGAPTDGSMAGTSREVLSPTKRTNPTPSKRWGRVRAFDYLSATPPEL
ncbi:hypothetical protein OG828_28335 [Streptomyces sp. NBC_00457]|uniref:hypothetical protein n=1 Tax=Streptomyces sp. NBC_00457 TaxID=2975748 RepID=UPI002E1F10B9